jgi:signal transduction histidine kinase
MATTTLERYRPVGTLPCAAGYVDSAGGILAANDALFDLQVQAGVTAVEGHTLPMLFVQGDRESVRDVLSARDAHARRAALTVSVAGSLDSMLAEFVPIRRRSHPVVWFVTLIPSAQAAVSPADVGSRAALTAGIVHDLRAPVQVLLGWTSLLRRQHDEPERIEHALTNIERNAKLLMDLLEELLAQTRPPWTSASMRQRALDLAELLRAEVRAVQPLVDQGGVELRLAVDSPAIVIGGNEVHLRRVLANLIGNALKFTPPGGTIECRLWRSPECVGLVVRDNGQGIDCEFLPRVFDAFSQEPGGLVQGKNGRGLGLHVVRQLVELYGGTVTAASEGSGCGATFTVILPVLPDVTGAGEVRHVAGAPQAVSSVTERE